VIAFEQVGDTDHDIKGGVVVAALEMGAAMQGIAQVEEIKFREPVALLKGGKGMELPAWKQVSGGPRRLLLLEQGANQGEGSVDDGEQGKRCKALKGSDRLAQHGDLRPDSGMPSPAPLAKSRSLFHIHAGVRRRFEAFRFSLVSFLRIVILLVTH